MKYVTPKENGPERVLATTTMVATTRAHTRCLDRVDAILASAASARQASTRQQYLEALQQAVEAYWDLVASPYVWYLWFKPDGPTPCYVAFVHRFALSPLTRLMYAFSSIIYYGRFDNSSQTETDAEAVLHDVRQRLGDAWAKLDAPN